MTGAAHAETDPEGLQLLVTPLRCSLVEVRKEMLLTPGSLLSKSYGTLKIIEGYRCSYGLNPEFEGALFAKALWATARDVDGEIRAAELRDHPFFVGTLFQPERRAFAGELPPLVRDFTKAMLATW